VLVQEEEGLRDRIANLLAEEYKKYMDFITKTGFFVRIRPGTGDKGQGAGISGPLVK
jgi:hypothetical protein